MYRGFAEFANSKSRKCIIRNDTAEPHANARNIHVNSESVFAHRGRWHLARERDTLA